MKSAPITHSYKLRISQGIYKGISFDMIASKYTRPTKALVKKSFFDTIRFDLQDSIFIECFAGSGQIALESLSLGAHKIVLLEKHSEVFNYLTKNIRSFITKIKNNRNLHNPINRIDSYNIDFLLSKDVLSTYLAPKIHRESSMKNDIITNKLANDDAHHRVIMYIDPPFSCRDGFSDIYSKILSFLESFDDVMLCSIHMIVMEMMSGVSIVDRIGSLKLNRIVKFGKTSLAYFTKD